MDEETHDKAETESRRGEQREAEPPPLIEHYRLLEKVGEGGMGEVAARIDNPPGGAPKK